MNYSYDFPITDTATATSFILIFALVYLVIIAALITLYIIIAIKFGKIAESKGYRRTTWAVASFFLGVPVWIMIAALPNLVQQAQLLEAIQGKQ